MPPPSRIVPLFHCCTRRYISRYTAVTHVLSTRSARTRRWPRYTHTYYTCYTYCTYQAERKNQEVAKVMAANLTSDSALLQDMKQQQEDARKMRHLMATGATEEVSIKCYVVIRSKCRR